MVNPVQRAARAGRKSRKILASVEIAIERDGVTGPGIVATVGESRIEEYEADGTMVSVVFRDYLVDRSGRDAYHISTGITAPEIGDVIVQKVLAGTSARFEVVPATSERGSRRSDRAGDVWRVHTKEMTPKAGGSNV